MATKTKKQKINVGQRVHYFGMSAITEYVDGIIAAQTKNHGKPLCSRADLIESERMAEWKVEKIETVKGQAVYHIFDPERSISITASRDEVHPIGFAPLGFAAKKLRAAKDELVNAIMDVVKKQGGSVFIAKPIDEDTCEDDNIYMISSDGEGEMESVMLCSVAVDNDTLYFVDEYNNRYQVWEISDGMEILMSCYDTIYETL